MSSSWEDVALLIKQVQHRNFRLLEAHIAPLEISIVQWNALRMIDRYPGCCMHRLSMLTFNSDQAFGSLATRLRRLGLIERRAGTGRAALHVLTPKGKTLLGKGRKLVEEVVTRTFAPLNAAEGKTLTILLRKILADEAPPEP